MDYKAWFVDFAKIAGRKNLNAYFVGVAKSILCCDRNDTDKQVTEIRNALESLDNALNDDSLPWVADGKRKAPAPTGAVKGNTQPNCSIDAAKVEPLFVKA